VRAYRIVPHFNRFIKQVDVAVTLCTRILEVLGSNHGQDTGYPDRFIAIFLSPFRQIRDNAWSKPRRLPFEPFSFYHTSLYNVDTDRFVKYPAKSFTSLFLSMEIIRKARVTQEAALIGRER
jgi:hypothetical protein